MLYIQFITYLIFQCLADSSAMVLLLEKKEDSRVVKVGGVGKFKTHTHC